MRQWTRSHPRQPLVCLVVGLFVVGSILRPQVDEIEQRANRESFVEDVLDKGMTAEQANCAADDLEDRFGPTLSGNVSTDDEARAVQEAIFGCLGLGPDLSECVLDALFEITGFDSATRLDVVAAEASLDANDREALAQAGLRCQGASEEVAACVTDAMRRELGEDVFGPRGLVLSPEDQQRQATLATECADAERDGGTTNKPKSKTEKPVDSLAVGDCFMVGGEEQTAVFVVEIRDCADPHDHEVFAIVRLPGDTYPTGDVEVDSNERCVAEFAPYVGLPFEESILGLVSMYPTPSSWAIGDREILCLLAPVGESEPLTGSMREAAV